MKTGSRRFASCTATGERTNSRMLASEPYSSFVRTAVQAHAQTMPAATTA